MLRFHHKTSYHALPLTYSNGKMQDLHHIDLTQINSNYIKAYSCLLLHYFHPPLPFLPCSSFSLSALYLSLSLSLSHSLSLYIYISIYLSLSLSHTHTHTHTNSFFLYLSRVAAGKKAKSDKATTKLSKKVNFEEAEREAAQQIEGGRVTPSLVKVGRTGRGGEGLCLN